MTRLHWSVTLKPSLKLLGCDNLRSRRDRQVPELNNWEQTGSMFSNLILPLPFPLPLSLLLLLPVVPLYI